MLHFFLQYALQTTIKLNDMKNVLLTSTVIPDTGNTIDGGDSFGT